MQPDWKQQVWEACQAHLLGQQEALLAEQQALQEAANSETKSSAGDKYETGRAMAQGEIEKLAARLLSLKAELALLESQKTSQNSRISPGALAQIAGVWYYIGPALGIIQVQGQKVAFLSRQAPLAQAIWGKAEGETAPFQGKNWLIERIV